MKAPTVWAFFYGSFINLEILERLGYVPERIEVARLSGFDIHIRPTATLVHSGKDCVYGIAAQATHEQLARLYGSPALASYRPEPVLVEMMDGAYRPAFCYIAPLAEDRPAEGEYLDRIIAPARQHGFPEWYIARLESFR